MDDWDLSSDSSDQSDLNEPNEIDKELDLSKSDIDDQKLFAISKMLTNDKNIEMLDLSNNTFGDQGLGYLCDALIQNKTLQVLNLSFNDITEQGYMQLARTLGKNKGLKAVLAIPNDYSVLTPDVLDEFVKYLKNNTRLVALQLEIVYRDPRINAILERNADLDWPNIKKAIADIAIGLYPLDIPPYVVLEIIDNMGYKHLPEIKKIEILQKVQRFTKK